MATTVETITSLSPELGTLAKKIDDSIKSINPNGSAPTWYWNGKSPITLTQGLDGLTILQLTERLQHLYIVLSRLYKAIGIINVSNDLVVLMRGLPIRSPSSNPSLLQTKVQKYSGYLDMVLGGSYCIAETANSLCKTKKSKQVQWNINSQTGEPIISNCYGPISNEQIKKNVADYATETFKGLQQRRDLINAINSTYTYQIKREIDSLKSSLASFYERFNALPELYKTEIQENVTPEFKAQLNKPFLEMGEQLVEAQNTPETEEETSDINWGAILVATLMASGAFFALKTYMNRK